MNCKIRNNVFETNSSSSHCLSFTPFDVSKINFNSSDYDYDIYPYTQDEINDPMIITDIKGKLRYFYTTYIQAGRDHSCDNLGIETMRELKKIFPLVTFIDTFPEHTYIIEDAEGLYENFGEERGKIHKWLQNPDLLKQFIVNGKIIIWNRDNWELNEKYHLDYNEQNKYNVIYFTG